MTAQIRKEDKSYTLLTRKNLSKATDGWEVAPDKLAHLINGAKPESPSNWKAIWLALQFDDDPTLTEQHIKRRLQEELNRKNLFARRVRIVSTEALTGNTNSGGKQGSGGGAGGGSSNSEQQTESVSKKDKEIAPPPPADNNKQKPVESSKPAKTEKNAETGAAPESETETRGCPISMVSGEELLSINDANLPGPVPFTWKRTYRSSHARDIGLGCGWTHSACERLTVTATDVEYYDDEGRCVPFARPRVHQDSRYIPGGMTLEHPNAECFILKQPGKPDYVFTTYGGTTAFRLSQIRHHNYQPANSELKTPARGYAIDLHYDAQNRLRRLAGNWGKTLYIERDHQGHISQVELVNEATGDRKQMAEYHFNANDDLIAHRNANNLGEDYSYDNHLLLQRTLVTGFSYYYQWDGNDHTARCLRNWGDNGIYDYKFEWDPANNTSKATDSRGYTTTFKYNDYGQITEEIDNEGALHQYRYDNGRKVSYIDPEGNETHYFYDGDNNPLGYRDPLGNRESYSYFKGKVTGYTNKEKAHWKHEYNNLGQLETTTDPYGLKTHYSYSAQGLLSKVVAPGNKTTIYQWNAEGDLKSITDPQGHKRLFTYNGFGQVVESELRLKGAILAGVTRYTYTATGLVDSITGPDGKTTHYQYNENDQLVKHTDPQGRITRFEYDGLSQVVKRINPEGHSLSYEYDKERNLTALINENGERYEFKYDGNERLIKETGFDGRIQHYKYNQAGQLIRHMDAGSVITEFERDALGNMLSKTSRSVTGENSYQEQNRYTYDALGRLKETYNNHQYLAFEYNLLGNITKEHSSELNNQKQRIKSSMRDIAYQNVWPGQRSQIALPDGQLIDYHFNEQHQLDKVSLNGRAITQIERDDFGREVSRTQGALTTHTEYDPSGRLQKQYAINKGNKQPSPILREYGYDEFGNLNRVQDGPVETKYVYDLLNRLKQTEAVNDGQLSKEEFHFDPAGNLLDSPNNQNTGNRLTIQGDRKFTYDKRGNLIRENRGKDGKLVTHYHYNLNNQLVKVEKNGQSIEYKYDPLGRRNKKIDEFGTTTYLWAGDQLIQEERNNLKKTYIHEPENFKPVAMVQDGEVYHYHLDHLGTPQELSNAKGKIVWKARYKTYGNVAYKEVDDIDNNIRFQGQYFDEETGLHYNRHRYYDPSVGQFITQDPIGLLGGVNNYQYAPNPTGWIDPFGLCKEQGDKPARKKPDFYVGPAGPEATLPSTGYRYMRYKDDDGKVNKFAPMTVENKSAPTTYFGFEKYDTGTEARDAFQVKGPEIGSDHTGEGSWSDARLRGEFDTLQLYENGEPLVRVPYMYGDTDKTQLEPIAEAYPEYGKGGAAQLHAEGKVIQFDKVDILPEKQT
ncbi:RHS repeat-associated core domain-containing protein [Teredinibacter sp. KSP-S5-2]|uniref:RHS repeat-associated core domain-containing protein n=1 Tax=Teredinibacter sp. KSP-S5-2 TaxID=3034506 RepID=UPI002934940F|nr:RHS repeat-associated core domain-containing protein [Teredinibacter sp. KSP-S5-2]WNO11135.1 RHS repeat-associated core domain-containing protein [Teredinibacter sp. KSP-S5-2]